MFKTIKFLAVSAIVLIAASCCDNSGSGNGGNGGVPQQGFHVTLSADTIYSNGSDVAEFTAYYNGVKLTADQLHVYQVIDEQQSETDLLKDLKFSTTVPGEFTFVFTYTTEEKEYTSDPFTVVAISEANVEPIKGENGISVRATSTLLQKGESVTFVVRWNGEVLTSLNGVTLKDANNDAVLTTGTKEVTGSNGVAYPLLTFTPSAAGTYSVYVDGGLLYDKSYQVTIKVVDYKIPSRPADTKPLSTSFKRRSLIMQFTGLNCSYCPYVREALENVMGSEEYADDAVLAVIHGDTYSPDKSFVVYHNNSLDLASALGVSSFPTYKIDWIYTNSNQGVSQNETNIKKYLDMQQKTPAKAGIAARMEWMRNTLLVRANVKAAADGDFYVGAWVLENGLKGTQAGTNNEAYDTHNDVLRFADSHPEGTGNWNYYGYPLGTLSKGDISEYLFEIELDTRWAASNCHLILFVAYYDSVNGRIEIVNAVETKSLTSGVSFDYAE